MKNTIIEKYKGALAILAKKPVLLWGLTLLTQLIAFLAGMFGVLPIVYIPIALALNASLCTLYLKGYREQEVSSADIFTGFNKFAHVAGGMAWRLLWIFIWALIPFAGIVFAIIKSYEYAFVPYILINQPEIGATEALKKSKEMTKGLKAKMFWSEFLVYVAYFVVNLVLGLFASIPYIGGIFAFVMILFNLLFMLLVGIFLGLIKAGFYDGAVKAETPQTIPETAEEIPAADPEPVAE